MTSPLFHTFNITNIMHHFRFTITNGAEFIPVDVMKDTLNNAIKLVESIYGGRYSIHAIESPMYCPPANRRQYENPCTVENSRFTSRPGCGITTPWANN